MAGVGDMPGYAVCRCMQNEEEKNGLLCAMQCNARKRNAAFTWAEPSRGGIVLFLVNLMRETCYAICQKMPGRMDRGAELCMLD